MYTMQTMVATCAPANITRAIPGISDGGCWTRSSGRIRVQRCQAVQISESFFALVCGFGKRITISADSNPSGAVYLHPLWAFSRHSANRKSVGLSISTERSADMI